MNERKGLSRELQVNLGEKLRDLYSAYVQSLPLYLVALARRVRSVGSAKDTPSNSISEMAGNSVANAFDPETVAILDKAFENAWKDLDSLKANPVTRTALATRLITLLNEGERNPSRLATKAVLELVAPHVPRTEA